MVMDHDHGSERMASHEDHFLTGSKYKRVYGNEAINAGDFKVSNLHLLVFGV
jgi:hypothetical protein